MKILKAVLVFAVVFIISLSLVYGYFWICMNAPIPMNYEKIEFESTEFLNASGNNYFAALTIRNVGTMRSILNSSTVFFNDKISNEYLTDTPICCFKNTTLTKQGETTTLYIVLPKGNTWKSNSSIQVTIQTKWGKDYETLLALP